MQDILVSVIMPTYGRPNFIEQALVSLASQSHESIEIVIVDDNGLDSKYQLETQSVIDLLLNKFSGRFSINYIVLPSNVGAAVARNIGVSKSNGSLLTFLDDDDTFKPDKIKKQVAHLSNANIDISICSFIRTTHQKNTTITSEHFFGNTFNIKRFLEFESVFTPMIMIRRSVFQEIDGFSNTKKYQDHVLLLKSIVSGKKIKYLDECLIVQNIYPISRITNSGESRKTCLIRFSLENKINNVFFENRLSLVKLKQISIFLPHLANKRSKAQIISLALHFYTREITFYSSKVFLKVLYKLFLL